MGESIRMMRGGGREGGRGPFTALLAAGTVSSDQIGHEKLASAFLALSQIHQDSDGSATLSRPATVASCERTQFL